MNQVDGKITQNTHEYNIEVCANSTYSAVMAEQGGASRVELCAGIPEGGTTPSYGTIRMTKELLSIKTNVIIRPRGGDFLYTEQELEIMIDDIKLCRTIDVSGVVFGVLTKDGEVNKEANKRLIEAAGDKMEKTFHRAFDMCSDPFQALEDIIELGFNTILTSGLQNNAIDGAKLIAQLIEQANGRIVIMPGCGVNEDNISCLAEITGAKWFHMSARKSYNSQMEYRNPNVSMGGTIILDEYKNDYTSAERVKASINALKE